MPWPSSPRRPVRATRSASTSRRTPFDGQLLLALVRGEGCDADEVADDATAALAVPVGRSTVRHELRGTTMGLATVCAVLRRDSEDLAPVIASAEVNVEPLCGGLDRQLGSAVTAVRKARHRLAAAPRSRRLRAQLRRAERDLRFVRARRAACGT